MQRPPSHLGLHHIALFVRDLVAARHFYVDLLGFRVEWEPDEENLYLTSGSDNLALHRRNCAMAPAAERLDHIGILVPDQAAVEAWHEYLSANNVEIIATPRTHRDGAHSFYCLDPDGVRVQIIYHPPVTDALGAAARTYGEQ
jgi:catechol 2,3-dioxygenase-like lactoylglutathione lyase family enzyme